MYPDFDKWHNLLGAKAPIILHYNPRPKGRGNYFNCKFIFIVNLKVAA
jgi:hypothetical protein